METNRLTIPHKELTERPFALVPLLDINPDLMHPKTGKRMAQYLPEGASTTMRTVSTRFAGMHG
jgi:2-amino-4-hydroxy-6-hydroxymethyldihydropteridine diphosphokinase